MALAPRNAPLWSNFKAPSWAANAPFSERTVVRVRKHEAKQQIFQAMMKQHKTELTQATRAVNTAQRAAATKKAALVDARAKHSMLFRTGRRDSKAGEGLRDRIKKLKSASTMIQNTLKRAQAAKKSTTKTLKRMTKAMAREQQHLVRNKARLGH